MPHKIDLTRQGLRARYLELRAQNGLIARMEGELVSLDWTESEIRTAQLIIAIESNASLSQRIRELETTVQRMTERSARA